MFLNFMAVQVIACYRRVNPAITAYSISVDVSTYNFDDDVTECVTQELRNHYTGCFELLKRIVSDRGAFACYVSILKRVRHRGRLDGSQGKTVGTKMSFGPLYK